MRPERNAKSQQKLAMMRCERDSAPGFHLELPLSTPPYHRRGNHLPRLAEATVGPLGHGGVATPEERHDFLSGHPLFLRFLCRLVADDGLLILGDDSIGERLQLLIGDDGKDHLACRHFRRTNQSLHIEPELKV